MEKEYPLISVVMPTYNGALNIERAINSALNQTYPNIEIIVVNDASKDNTKEVVERIKDTRVRLINHEVNKNGSAARNTGIRAAKGQYIALLDDDDKWLPEKLIKQMDYLSKKDQKIWKACITSSLTTKGDKTTQTILKKEGDLRLPILTMESSFGMGSSLLIQKVAVEKVGFFDEKYNRHQDLEFILRYLRLYKLAVLKEPLLQRFGPSGVPSGDKLAEVKKIFLTDFAKDIDSFGKDQADKIYARQWMQVSKNYALDGNIKQTFHYLKKSLSYRLLFSKRLKIIPMENYFAILYYLLKSKITGQKSKNRFTEDNLSKKKNAK